MPTENGWEPHHAPASLLEWRKIPGTNVTLQLMKGWPSTVLTAFAADYNAYVEPLRDADSGGFTPTNSVATSNHLNGTAMDLNWNGPDGKTFRLGISEERAYPGDKARNLRDLMNFYEFEGLRIIFCGGAWSIKDWMHFQMNGNTWKNPKVLRFIEQRIRPDGFSIYKRQGTPIPPPPPPPPLSQSDRHALEVIAEGRRRGISPRGIQIALATCLVESNLKMYANSTVPESLKRPHDAVGNDHDSVGLFQQRYPTWGKLDCLMNAACSAGLFYDRLVTVNYNDPNRSPGSFAADIQRPAAQYRGRYDERFGDAVRLYDRLAGVSPPLPPGEDELSAEAERKINDLWELFLGAPDFDSWSPLKKPGEGKVGNLVEFIRWMDSNIHVMVEIMLTKLRFPDPSAIALLQSVANDPDPKRNDHDRKLAKAILAELGNPPPTTAVVPLKLPPEWNPSSVRFTPPGPEIETEVLPAKVETSPVKHEPEDLLDVLDRLDRFNKSYRKKFDNLTEGEK